MQGGWGRGGLQALHPGHQGVRADCAQCCVFLNTMRHNNAGRAMYPGHNCEFAKCLTVEQ